MEFYNGLLVTAVVIASLGGCVANDNPPAADGCPGAVEQQTRSSHRLVSKPFGRRPDDDGKPVRWRIDGRSGEGRSAARAANALLPRRTEHLLALGFGFQLPDTARIQGVTVEIQRHRSRFGAVRDETVQLVQDGRPVGRDHARGQPWSDRSAVEVYGDRNDRWRLELDAADVSRNDFGVALSALMQPFDNRQEAFVSSVTMTVYWCQF